MERLNAICMKNFGLTKTGQIISPGNYDLELRLRSEEKRDEEANGSQSEQEELSSRDEGS